MNAVGITAEFNPFHSGHKYLIDNARRSFPSCAVVCVMSGNFVQHGGPAAIDKYTRAKLAILEGADLVIELPTYYAVNAAPYFAQGSISVMKSLGCVEAIAFGSETANLDRLEALASMEETEQSRKQLHSLLDSGMPFSKAFAAATGTLELGPNDILGLEYLKQINRLDAGFKALAVKRIGASHGDDSTENDDCTSATAIRKVIQSGNDNQFTVNLPNATADFINSDFESLRNAVISREKLYFDIIRYKLLSTESEEIATTLEISEGLENRLIQYARLSSDLDELIKNVKSKRYTYSRISRILTQFVLGLNKLDFMRIQATGASYIKVLAFNDKGSVILRQASKQGAKVITNVNRPGVLNSAQETLLAADLRASDIYNSLSGLDIYSESDQLRTPFILKNA